jgi:hypothetical protein
VRPPSKRSFLLKRAPDLDLVPVMGLFVALVPFLLSVAVFTQVALIAMPLPKVAQSESEVSTVEKEKFMLKVYVIDDKTKGQVRQSKGYVVDCNCLKEPKFLPLTKDGKYDGRALNEVVLKIKQKNEDQKILVLIPGYYVDFETMVTTLDATRETHPDLVPDAPRYELFPDVILEVVDG